MLGQLLTAELRGPSRPVRIAGTTSAYSGPTRVDAGHDAVERPADATDQHRLCATDGPGHTRLDTWKRCRPALLSEQLVAVALADVSTGSSERDLSGRMSVDVYVDGFQFAGRMMMVPSRRCTPPACNLPPLSKATGSACSPQRGPNPTRRRLRCVAGAGRKLDRLKPQRHRLATQRTRGDHQHATGAATPAPSAVGGPRRTRSSPPSTPSAHTQGT